VSFNDDHGGNTIKATGLCSGNLHEVWDTCILEKQLGLDITALAAALRSSVQDDTRALWTRAEPMAWANESFMITLTSTVEYCVQKDHACWYAYDHETFDVNENNRVVIVDDIYVIQHLPMIKQRLTQAGIRLGSLLNQTLGRP
jgi:hypothetical protein